jgi:hypothetical protein
MIAGRQSDPWRRATRDVAGQAGRSTAPVPIPRGARVALWASPGSEAEAGSCQSRARPIPPGSRDPNRLGRVREERQPLKCDVAKRGAAFNRITCELHN